MLSESKNNIWFSLAFTLCYFSLSLIGILHHEIWLDEAHSFLIARDSASFSELVSNTRQEGHPMIWYIILWFLTKITHDVFYMQFVHIVISTLGIFLMFHFSSFGKLKKVLFAFSYYFFYEYNIISRNYAICIFCVTLFCILLCRENRNYILIAFILLLLSNSHFLGLILSFPLAGVAFILLLNDQQKAQDRRTWIITGLVLIVGYIICVIHVLPQEDSIFTKLPRDGYFSVKRWSSFTAFFKGLYQFPDIWIANPWNSNLFTSNKTIGFILALILPVIVIRSFWSKPLSLLIIIISGIGITLFFFSEIMHNYTVRHWGFIFLAFYVALWVEEGIDQKIYSDKLKKWFSPSFLSTENTWLKKSLIYSALVIQCGASLYSYISDINNTFSNSLKVANYVQQNHYENGLIIMSSFTAGPAISAYLDKKLYYPEYHNYGSYGLWNTSPWIVSREELLKQIYALKKYKQALLILNQKKINQLEILNSKDLIIDNDQIRIKYLQTFDKGIVGHENFDLFLVTYK
jgi:hypothetical protein